MKTLFNRVTFFTMVLLFLSCSRDNGTDEDSNVYDGNLELITQAQIDNFNFTKVTGNILIGNSSQPTNKITNLNGLSSLVKIGGDLDIYENKALTSLSGLDNLSSIGPGQTH